MPRQFTLPDLGEGLTEAEIVAVLVHEGDLVREDAPLLEVETDKAQVEIPSPMGGRVEKIHVTPGQTVKVGAVLVTFADNGAPTAPSASSRAAAAPPPAPPAAASPSPAPPAVDTTWVLDERGAAPVRAGSTVAEANSAVPGGLNRTAGLESGCDVVRPKNGLAGLSFMVAEGRVVRVDVHDSAQIATPSGAHVGDAEARVRSLYPAARVMPHKYDDRGHYIVVIPGAPADTLHRIVFETDGTVVTTMRGGLWPYVEYVEGCS